MLEVIDLDFDYQEQPLLHGVSFKVPPGGLLHLKGANGAGKTTLLKVIAGLHQPLQGQIRFFEQPVFTMLSAYQRQLSFVGHKTGINPYLTIKENCLFDLSYGENKTDITALAAHFQLERFLDHPCGLLSAGQRRQVGLLRLWMTARPLWLLDEPLVALDETALATLMHKIEEHRAQGGMVVLTSHQHLPASAREYQEYHL
ncbi:cytochrome c biogenesis heme-transporting ATPase CcmA [Legionella worsleiensis]|uniref:Cytochrome c biogenesis protein CcmA n=1 Tax=Legionella worsleiensis TaxID=45076 RepID=A0A0W1A3P5_9GAMM|nr:cytochrome c biogenesis heme-transporting ATPase CcmA [Legionella worsleiensis]KTD75979.1 cytochrome c biogenesis protein CcmA [Legionella worsleiensis]STY32992.1 heme exporter ATP-binding protein CcmA [Legionella worsleiensis]